MSDSYNPVSVRRNPFISVPEDFFEDDSFTQSYYPLIDNEEEEDRSIDIPNGNPPNQSVEAMQFQDEANRQDVHPANEKRYKAFIMFLAAALASALLAVAGCMVIIVSLKRANDLLMNSCRNTSKCL